MEVSSHALVLGRVDGVVFDVATFLTHDAQESQDPVAFARSWGIDREYHARVALEREPRTVPLGREPRPPVVIDEGPLVLVETRKDLSQLKLPFDQTA